MPKYTYIVLTNAKDGREAEYNDWYDNQHLADVLAIPGMVGAKRFYAAPEMVASGLAKWNFLAIYDIDTDDLDVTMAELVKRAGTQAMLISDALNVENAHAMAYLPMASKQVPC